MGSVNRVLLVGTISTYGVEVRYLDSGQPCASFTLVLSELGQDGRTHTTLIDCQCFGRKAAAASELEPGTLVLFEGKIARRKKGVAWEMQVVGWDLTPVGSGPAMLTGRST